MSHPSHKGQTDKLTIGVLYGFRALMVLFVCNYHIWQLGWLPQSVTILGQYINFDFFTRSGYMFVDGMLLLSGFLLYLPYAREKAEGIPVPEAGRFYFNRLTRILPSYLLSILLVLFLIALPQGAYRDGSAMRKDIWTHLTFTYTFFKDTYLHTPLNGALWTVAVEMQFYFIFPLLARAAQKRPVLTLSAMTAVGLLYRGLIYFKVEDTAALINQMPGFLDVYALGMLGAMAYVALRGWLPEAETKKSLRRWVAGLAAPICLLALYAVTELIRLQSIQGLNGVDTLRKSQMLLRFPLAFALLCAMLSAAVMPRFLQKLLDNRLTRFLATISFNLYVWHQVLSAQLARAYYPDTEALHNTPHLREGYTLLCFSVSILAAMLATYGVEKPCAKLANTANQKLQNRRRTKGHEGSQTIQAKPAADSVFMRTEERAAGTD